MNLKDKKSDVWNFFEELEGTSKARCKFCQKYISRGGKSLTTSNMNKHLKTFHAAQVYKHKQNQSLGEMSTDKAPCVDEPMPIAGTSAGSGALLTFATPLQIDTNPTDIGLVNLETSLDVNPNESFTLSPSPTISNATPSPVVQTPKRRPTIQPTIGDIVKKKMKYNPSDLKAKAITRKIMEMICIDCQPLSVVEDKGFVRLINHLEPRYEIPKRKYFSTVELTKVFNKTKTAVEEIIAKAKYVSLTTDMWTSSANDDYLGLTAHFFDESFEWKHISLAVAPFPEISHTGAAINSFIESIIEKWGLTNKVHVIVRDNGKNMVAALDMGNYTPVPCLAHTLQLVVKDGILCQRCVMNILAQCRKIVGHFKHSSKAYKILRNAQETLGIPRHKLVQDEPTRWNSSKHMCDRLLEQKRAILFASPDLKLNISLSNDDWELIEEAVKLMKIFDDATFAVSTLTTTISEVIPIVNSAMKELETSPSNQTTGLSTFIKELKKSLQKHYGDLEEKNEYSIATLLDPRLKGSVFISKENMNTAKQNLIAEAEMEAGHRSQTGTGKSYSSNPSEAITSSSNQSGISKTQMVSSQKAVGVHQMWKRYATLIKDVDQEDTSNDFTAEEEVNKYLAEPLAAPDCEVGKYWSTQQTRYPCLTKMALKYLSAPPATVFSERLFSTSGIICDRKRNRLDPDRVEKLVFLNRNIQYCPEF